MQCRCEEIERLDGADADIYANEHLTLIERGRDPYEMYRVAQPGEAGSWTSHSATGPQIDVVEFDYIENLSMKLASPSEYLISERRVRQFCESICAGYAW